jgi:hypothetical protein
VITYPILVGLPIFKERQWPSFQRAPTALPGVRRGEVLGPQWSDVDLTGDPRLPHWLRAAAAAYGQLVGNGHVA